MNVCMLSFPRCWVLLPLPNPDCDVIGRINWHISPHIFFKNYFTSKEVIQFFGVKHWSSRMCQACDVVLKLGRGGKAV